MAVLLTNINLSPTLQRGAHHEESTYAVALVFVVNALGLSRAFWNGDGDFPDQLLGGKVPKALDFWHAAHHISLALEKLELEAKERAPVYRQLRKQLRHSRWRAVIEEFKGRAAEQGVDEDRPIYRETDFLNRHGEYGHLQYLKYKRHRVTLGSGAIESSIRRVINLRLKGDGIFWQEVNAEAVMTMRAKLLSDQWEQSVGLVRERWKLTRATTYRWRAVNVGDELKREYFEEDGLPKNPKISGFEGFFP